MKFTQDQTGGNAIQGYAKGQVTIAGVIYRSSLVVTPSQVLQEWRPDEFSELIVRDFALLAELEPEIVILGTGAVHRFPHPSLSQPLMQQRIGLESMDTAAACRTYNILMAEGRKIAAALFMI